MNHKIKYERAKKNLIQAGMKLTFLYDQNTRTQIIYNGIYLDELVGEIIAWHFCPSEEKHLWFKSLIFRTGELSFSKKIDILKEILKHSYPDIFDATRGLIERLHEIRRMRNDFAHSELIINESKLLENFGKPPKGICLRSIKKGGMTEAFYSEADMKEQIKLAGEVGLFVQYVYAEVKNRVTGGTKNFEPLLKIFKRQSPHVLKNPTKPKKV